jgi:hypothetical protein
MNISIVFTFFFAKILSMRLELMTLGLVDPRSIQMSQPG